MILNDNIFSASQTAAGATHPFFDDDLPEVHEPYLPPLEESENDVYTLVLDLDETLVHYFDVSLNYHQLGADSHFLIRPGCFEFLDEMAKYYELVIFTAAMQDVSTIDSSMLIVCWTRLTRIE